KQPRTSRNCQSFTELRTSIGKSCTRKRQARRGIPRFGPLRGRSLGTMAKKSGKEIAGGWSTDLLAGGERANDLEIAGLHEIVLFAEAAIDMASHACGERSFDTRTVAANQNGEGDFGMRFVGIREKPADVRKLIGAGAGFPGGHFVAPGVEAALPGAVENGGQHSFAQFRKQRADI